MCASARIHAFTRIVDHSPFVLSPPTRFTLYAPRLTDLCARLAALGLSRSPSRSFGVHTCCRRSMRFCVILFSHVYLTSLVFLPYAVRACELVNAPPTRKLSSVLYACYKRVLYILCCSFTLCLLHVYLCLSFLVPHSPHFCFVTCLHHSLPVGRRLHLHLVNTRRQCHPVAPYISFGCLKCFYV